MKNNHKNALVIFFAAGLPAGIGVALVDHYLAFKIGRAVLIGAAGFIVIGACLAMLGSWFAHFPRKNRGITFLHYFIMPIGGILLGVLFSFAGSHLIDRGWKSLQSPPEEVVRFIPSDNPTLYGHSLFVETKSGATYMLDCASEDKCEWAKKEYAPTEPPEFQCYSEPEEPKMPNPPGNPVDSIQSTICGVDYFTFTKFVLLDDGRLFYWEDFSSINNLLIQYMGFSFFGFLAGVAASIATHLLRKKQVEVDISDVQVVKKK